ncbi:MAG: hypothetical protein GXN94_05760 [Aquificae bacterium]|nr:hypothetical protein [Aquificota bacterium]
MREYLGRTVISRVYGAVFLELYYHITEELKISYTQLKKTAKEYYKQKGLKVPINKHTAVGAYIATCYGEIYGKIFEDLRLARNDVDYNLRLQYVGDVEREVDTYIKKAEILLKEVLG